MTSSWGMIKVSCYLLLCSAIATVTTDPSDSDFNVETLTASPSGKLCAVSVTIMIIANRKCLYCAQGHETPLLVHILTPRKPVYSQYLTVTCSRYGLSHLYIAKGGTRLLGLAADMIYPGTITLRGLRQPTAIETL